MGMLGGGGLTGIATLIAFAADKGTALWVAGATLGGIGVALIIIAVGAYIAADKLLDESC